MYNSLITLVALLPVVAWSERLGAPSSGDVSSGEGIEQVGSPIQFEPQQYVQSERKLRKIGAPQETFDDVTEKEIQDKEFFRNNAIELLEASPLDDEEERRVISCGANEKVFKLDLWTDNYGFETSWILQTSSGQLIASGPPYNTNYADNTYYTGSMCLPPKSYKLIVQDKFADGMCCKYGNGHYDFYVDGQLQYRAPQSNQQFDKREHSFTVAGVNANARSGCNTVTIEMKVDQYAQETSWTLRSSNGAVAMSQDANLPSYGYNKVEKCIPPGDYTFRINDNDGICCRYGEGYYKISVDGYLLVSGGAFQGSKSHTIKVGYDYFSKMSSRDLEWLNAHNTRRKTWHERQGKSYNPLRWSTTLASDAKSWANQLLNDCNVDGIHHQSNVLEGENLAKNKGAGQFGSQYPADNIVGRWVEFEQNWPWPDNAHLTQVLWRPSDYVGCGDASKSMGGGQVCHVQVCRYTKAGNCSMGKYNGNWRAAVFEDDSACGPECVDEGCYAP